MVGKESWIPGTAGVLVISGKTSRAEVMLCDFCNLVPWFGELSVPGVLVWLRHWCREVLSWPCYWGRICTNPGNFTMLPVLSLWGREVSQAWLGGTRLLVEERGLPCRLHHKVFTKLLFHLTQTSLRHQISISFLI
jgi:hypothetical protein